MQRASDGPVIQRKLEIESGEGWGVHTSDDLRYFLDTIAGEINAMKPPPKVKRGPLAMIHSSEIYQFADVAEVIRYMTDLTVPAPMPGVPTGYGAPPPTVTATAGPEIVYGADHGDYHFTGKVTVKKAQWTLPKSAALELMEAEFAKHVDHLMRESKSTGWDSWYVGGDTGKSPVGDTVAGPETRFCLQVQVSREHNTVSYHGYPDQRLKKTGVARTKKAIS